MNRLLISAFALLLSFGLSTDIFAQSKPAPSPLGKVYQKVGLTDVEITYSRPGVKEREIFGDLVPFDKLWRTGANAPTKISFSTDVMIQGNKVEKGEYAIYTVPGQSEWEVIISSATGSARDHDDSKAVTSFKVPANSWDVSVETFTIMFGNVKDTSTDIGMFWDKSFVNFQLTVEKTW